MSIFTPAEVSYLRGHRLGRMATVDAAGKPHAVPVGYRYDQSDTITIGGHRLDRSKKWRDLHDNPHVAFVVDDLVSVDPWRPQGVEIRGRGALHGAHGEQIGPGFGAAWVEIRPDRIVSWGIDSEPFGPPNARSVS